ncbi:MAG: hypothetical protein ACFFCQ_12330 [Promethearchaeota archaeon]
MEKTGVVIWYFQIAKDYNHMNQKLIEELLQQVLENQESLFQRLESLEAKIGILKTETEHTNLVEELPNHLRTTYDVIQKEGEIDASNISNITGRSRNLESMYCCQLERMGLLERRSEGRKQFFTARYPPISDENSQKLENSTE